MIFTTSQPKDFLCSNACSLYLISLMKLSALLLCDIDIICTFQNITCLCLHFIGLDAG